MSTIYFINLRIFRELAAHPRNPYVQINIYKNRVKIEMTIKSNLVISY